MYSLMTIVTNNVLYISNLLRVDLTCSDYTQSPHNLFSFLRSQLLMPSTLGLRISAYEFWEDIQLHSREIEKW